MTTRSRTVLACTIAWLATGRAADGQPSDGQPSDGRPPDGRPPDGRDPDGQPSDGRDPDGRDPDGRPDGRDPDGQPPDGRDPDAQPPDGRDPDGRDPDGRPPDGRPPDGRAPDAITGGPVRAPRLIVGAEVFATGAVTRAEGDTLSAFDLGRAELGAELGLGHAVSAAVRLDAVRSATAGGTIGIDGDSLVVRIKRAQVSGRFAVGPVAIAGAAGMVADPWIERLEDEYPLRALAATATEHWLGWDSSDLGAVVAAGVGPVRAAIAVGNGEGRRFPERNDGKNLTAVIDARIVDTAVAGQPVAVHLRAVARDGSLGPASARDRRFGGGVLVRAGGARAGGEVVRALGLDGRGDVEAIAVAAWAAVPVWRRVGVAARWGWLRLDAGATSTELTGAVSFDLVHPEADRAVRAFLAVERDRDRTTAPGAAADATRILLVLAASGTAAME